MTAGVGPLAGLRVLELGGVGPGPFAAMMLSDLGADVLRVVHPSERTLAGNPVLLRNRRQTVADLKDPVDLARVRKLAAEVDVLIEGFRPGVMERLGLAPEELLDLNSALVVGRMTGFGQDGPLAPRAGHDINYIALAGVLSTIGTADEPMAPVNLVGDFGGGGMLLALGIVSAVLHARETGTGQIVDAAMVEGASLLASMVHGMRPRGLWRDEREANIVDGGAPFYRTYRCADGGHVAVGAVEPQFFARLLVELGLEDHPACAQQHDRRTWPQMRQALADAFAQRTRDEWAAQLEGLDVCVTPVLSIDEASRHPHNLARDAFVPVDGVMHPAPAPRFSATPLAPPKAAQAPV